MSKKALNPNHMKNRFYTPIVEGEKEMQSSWKYFLSQLGRADSQADGGHPVEKSPVYSSIHGDCYEEAVFPDDLRIVDEDHESLELVPFHEYLQLEGRILLGRRIQLVPGSATKRFTMYSTDFIFEGLSRFFGFYSEEKAKKGSNYFLNKVTEQGIDTTGFKSSALALRKDTFGVIVDFGKLEEDKRINLGYVVCGLVSVIPTSIDSHVEF